MLLWRCPWILYGLILSHFKDILWNVRRGISVVYDIELNLKFAKALTCENLIFVQLEFESNICVFYQANQK